MSIKVKLEWNKIEQDAFKEIKRIVACDTLLTYLYFDEEFKSHTDDRNLHLGAVIRRKGKPIDFYSRKLTVPQRRYTVTQREILSLFETLKEFITMLLGQILIIYNNH